MFDLIKKIIVKMIFNYLVILIMQSYYFFGFDNIIGIDHIAKYNNPNTVIFIKIPNLPNVDTFIIFDI